MYALVLLHLITSKGKRLKKRFAKHISLFATSLKKSIKQEHDC